MARPAPRRSGAPRPDAPFTMSQAESLAGIPRSYIESLVDEDVLTSGSRVRFTFQDLVLLRAARQMSDEGVPRHRILGALANVRDSLVPPAHAETLKFRKAAPLPKRSLN